MYLLIILGGIMLFSCSLGILSTIHGTSSMKALIENDMKKEVGCLTVILAFLFIAAISIAWIYYGFYTIPDDISGRYHRTNAFDIMLAILSLAVSIGLPILVSRLYKEQKNVQAQYEEWKKKKSEEKRRSEDRYYDEFVRQGGFEPGGGPRRQELLHKAEQLGGSYKSDLESLYNKQANTMTMRETILSMKTLGEYVAAKPVQKYDPYIRGGAASALGGPALGLYTALKTDEENKRKEEARQETLEHVESYKNQAHDYERELDKINRQIKQLEQKIESEWQQKHTTPDQ